MKEETVTDAMLRDFLLGKLDDEERERIETLFLTESQARERVLAAEQDLIEDYLEDSLTRADRERFLSRYAQTPAQERKLRITKSIKDWAIAQTALTKTSAPTLLSWNGLRRWLRLRPAFVVPVAVATMIAIVVAAVWLNGRMQQRNRRLAIEQKLAQLNSPSSLGEVPPQMVSLDLSPVTVRSAQPQAELKTRGDIRVVELRLPWIRNENYSTFQAEVRRLDEDEVFIIPKLPAVNAGWDVIRMRLPADILSRGQYRIDLTGITANGAYGLTQEYTFVVSE